MLPLKYLFENYDLAKLALRNWAHDEDLDETLQWFRISSNAVYPYRCNGSLNFLRLSPVQEKCEDNLRAELQHIVYLRAYGYPAMRPVPAHNGELLLTLHTEWGDYFACAFAGVPGEQIEDTEHTPEVLHAYGAALGGLHALSRGKTFGKQTHEDTLAWIEQQFQHHHAPQSAFEACKAIRTALDALPRNDDTYGPVHYDFEPDNVFYDAANGTCHVIDFEDGMMHFYALDIEQALNELPAEEHKAFLEGYQTQFPYTEDTAAMRPLMRRFCDLYAYASLLHALAEIPEEQPDWLLDLIPFLTNRRDQMLNNITTP